MRNLSRCIGICQLTRRSFLHRIISLRHPDGRPDIPQHNRDQREPILADTTPDEPQPHIVRLLYHVRPYQLHTDWRPSSAVNEVGPIGALQSYATSPGGGLTLIDEASSGGNGPAFCAPLSTGQVAIMNVSSPSGVRFRFTASAHRVSTALVTARSSRPPAAGPSSTTRRVCY